VPDPRVPVRNEGRDVAGYGVELWHQLKYNSFGDPLPLARWEEAQLILAEAAVAAGRLQDAVAILNTLHGNAGLPSFESADPAEIMEMIIYNRRAELFLEGQHLMDMKRYELPLYPAPGLPFFAGGIYGNQTCFPLPDVERFNNPSVPT
jgi:starch-binding outer membrane protein, SusD/RagB family